MKKRNLSELARGKCCTVEALCCDGAIRRRFSDLGIIPGVKVECVGISPMGDPRAYLVRGKTVAIRNVGARGILVTIEPSPEK